MQQDAHEFLNYLLNTIADLLQGIYHCHRQAQLGLQSLCQGFSQKSVQASIGCPLCEEIQGKFTLSVVILWENMPSGLPLFSVWLKACPLPDAKCVEVSNMSDSGHLLDYCRQI